MKLSDKYTLDKRRIFNAGIQALAHLPIDHMRRDAWLEKRAGESLPTVAFLFQITVRIRLLGQPAQGCCPGG